ncbi:MAG: primosomal protein N', partial [Methylococcales bacterium]|nr:primosomal protein N' [Methylococcales bacterium]
MIFKIAIASPLYQLFDYLPPLEVEGASIQLGSRVVVPFGRGDHKKIGVLLAISDTSDFKISKLKRVERVIDTCALLSPHDLTLLRWVSDYYHYPIGDVISLAFPTALRQGKAALLVTEKSYALTDAGATTDSQTLQRAPKQQALLEKFQQHGASLSVSELTLWDDHWRTAVKPLMTKQLLHLDTKTTPSKTTASIVNHPPLI